uniref:Uncharacterized protein n=1 Tax=Oryza sativa subsp. japonica TaxID=39947 RepID=Q69TU5_ORYSJ|nr:hypothetical protein [Oryza sativa Japonica Group]
MLPPALVPAQEDASFCSGGRRDKGGGRGGGGEGAFSFFTSPKQAVTTTGTNASGGCGLSLAFPDASEHGLHRHQRLLLLPFALTQQG